MAKWQRALMIFGMCLLVSSAHAQRIDIEALKNKARANADEFAELRNLLSDPDVNLRLAVFDEMVSQGSPSLYEMAVSTAIADTDETIRARALWEILSRRTTLNIIIDPQNEMPADARDAVDDAHLGSIQLTVHNVFPEQSCLNFYRSSSCHNLYSGDISGLLLAIKYTNLQGELTLGYDGVMRGYLLNLKQAQRMPVELRLR